MGINGIGTAGYQMAEYTTRKAEGNADYGIAGFLEIVEEKAAQDNAVDYDEKAFEMVGAHASRCSRPTSKSGSFMLRFWRSWRSYRRHTINRPQQ